VLSGKETASTRQREITCNLEKEKEVLLVANSAPLWENVRKRNLLRVG
jgi:hypothetical protein